MILPQDREEALIASREVMDPEDWERLAARLMSAEDVERLGEGAGPEPCEVRLLGGMSVKVGERTVMERDWRKRKARILFAMLALQQGRDVPRDQILEHLWPDMDEERARNNLYVIWSAVKAALSPDADKGTPCPYVESARGVCKSVPDLIHTDVDEFEKLVARGIAQEEAGNSAAALESYDKACELYRGDLLPGDMYDDWFAAARDHYRQEFSDAMHRAAELALSEGDASRANRFARRALEHDSWREDLYQVALKSQIASGQRSAAVDTYFACKGKLSEDLGLDPSSETTRLYEQVLAMEVEATGQTTYSTGAPDSTCGG
jgi:DNA-binding SARP family transcriptional activator